MGAGELHLARGFTLPLDIVTEAIGIVATRGAGKSYASAVVLEEAHAAGVPFVVLDPSGVYHGLRSSADGEKAGLPVYVLGGPHGDVPLEDSAGKFTADLVVDSGHSFVLDLSDFTKTKMRRFVADFLDRLYDRKARSRTTLLLVVDEADEFAPQKPRGDTINSLAAMETIAKRGRARGLGIVMITQRTQALNKDVLDLIETLIAMRQLAERSRDSVKGWIADKELRDDAGIIESLQSLPTGTAWVWSPLRGILEKVAIRRIRTFDSYSTPKPGQVKAEPRRRAELDLDALGEQMRATVERAKASDPAELRKTIRELERDVAQERRLAERAAAAETVEKVVEVPVLLQADLDHLRAQIDRLFELRAELLGRLHDVAGATSTLLDQAQAAAAAKPAKPSGARAPLTAGGASTRRPNVETAASPKRHTPPAAPPSQGVTGPQQRVLDAIAWLNTVGFPQPSKLQVGFIAGYRVGKRVGGTYGNILGQLRGAGLIDYPGTNVALTDAGAELANVPDIEQSTHGLQQAVYARLDNPERRVLEVIVAADREPLTKQDVGAAAGYTVGDRVGGTFGNILGRLRSLGLIDYPAPGLVAAEPVLFLDGARA